MAMLFFTAQKKSGKVKEINITDAQYFVPVAIMSSPTHTPQQIERIVCSFFKCSSLHYFYGDASSRGGLKASPKRKKIILPTHAKRMMQAVMKGWIKQLIVVIHD